jgi:opacity protein-like surface antigen
MYLQISQPRLLFTAFIFIISASLLHAQNLHVSGRFGFSNYQGDLQDRRLSTSQAKLAGSIGLRYDLSEHFTARGFFTLSTLMAADVNNKNNELKKRNLDFHTRLFDWELGMQYHLFSLNNKWWTPYIFAGVGLFHFKPATRDINGNKVFLTDYSTEGQGFVRGRDPYSLWQFSVPFGIGAEYAISEDLRVGLEFGYRSTFTDYLDDVSKSYVDQSLLLNQKGPEAIALAYRGNGSYPAAGDLRGNENNKDAYYFVQLTVTLRPYVDWYARTSGVASFKKNKKVGCPANRGIY